ncbi:MAG TPA: flavin reductase family protein [Chloroflexota bacterium]|nr:flavin reductase family protein [Chloroflexota bacterium]
MDRSLPTDVSALPLTADSFKSVFRHLATGVTIVTTRHTEAVHGATVSAFIPVSLEPMQVLVSLGRGNRLAGMIRDSGIFAVSILGHDQEHISRLFANPNRTTDPRAFEEAEEALRLTAATGAPIIAGCLAAIDCTLVQTLDSGDHTLLIGAVQALSKTDNNPLLYYNGAYRHLD